MSSISGSCPYRELDWVFQRAQLVNANDTMLPPSRELDGHAGFGWIRKTARYMRDLTAPDRNMMTILKRYGGLHWAYGIYTNPTMSMLRLSLELAILTQKTNSEIYDSILLTSPSTVEAYEAVFFNIRPYFRAKWAVPLALNRNLDPNQQRMPPQNLYKLCAWFRGLDYTMTVLNRFSHVDHVAASMVTPTMAEDVIMALKTQALIAANQVSTLGQGANELLATFIKNREVETKDNLNDTSTDQLAIALEVLQSQVEGFITVGGCDPETGQQVLMPTHLLRNTAVEPQLSATKDPVVMRRLNSAEYPNMLPV